MANVAFKIVWIAVGLIILATLGRYLFFKYQHEWSDRRPLPPKEAPIPEPVPWHKVDAEIASALKRAGDTAKETAEAQLNVWIRDLMTRVDDNFLEWYFSYWNQQWLGLKGIGYWGLDKLMATESSMVEKITAEVQEEFTKLVLQPRTAQLVLEKITRETLTIYVTSLQNNLTGLPDKYNIPQAQWDRHLDDIAVIAVGAEANREIPLTLKALTASGAAAGTLLLKQLKPVIAKVGAKIFAKTTTKAGGKMAVKAASTMTGKAAAKVASKTGAKVAAKAGGNLLGPIVGVGIIIWDVWDHHHTEKVERPILRQNILDYLDMLRERLLNDPEGGVMAAVYSVEAKIREAIQEKP